MNGARAAAMTAECCHRNSHWYLESRISIEAHRSVATSLGRTSWQGAGTLVGGGEIERRVAATGRRALGVGLFDEGVAQAGRAGVPGVHALALGPGDGMARGRHG